MAAYLETQGFIAQYLANSAIHATAATKYVLARLACTNPLRQGPKIDQTARRWEERSKSLSVAASRPGSSPITCYWPSIMNDEELNKLLTGDAIVPGVVQAGLVGWRWFKCLLIAFQCLIQVI